MWQYSVSYNRIRARFHLSQELDTSHSAAPPSYSLLSVGTLIIFLVFIPYIWRIQLTTYFEQIDTLKVNINYWAPALSLQYIHFAQLWVKFINHLIYPSPHAQRTKCSKWGRHDPLLCYQRYLRKTSNSIILWSPSVGYVCIRIVASRIVLFFDPLQGCFIVIWP